MNALVKEIELPVHKLTVSDLLILDEGGAFAGLPRVELLDGKLYEVNAQKSVHSFAKTELGYRLRQQLDRLQSDLSVIIELTIKLPPHSAPEPDIAIVDTAVVPDYHPAETVKLVVEISSSTLKIDTGYKKALYADAGIPEYWVVDIEKKAVHLFWSPEGEDYRENIVVEIGEELTSRTIRNLVIDTAGIL